MPPLEQVHWEVKQVRALAVALAKLCLTFPLSVIFHELAPRPRPRRPLVLRALLDRLALLQDHDHAATNEALQAPVADGLQCPPSAPLGQHHHRAAQAHAALHHAIHHLGLGRVVLDQDLGAAARFDGRSFFASCASMMAFVAVMTLALLVAGMLSMSMMTRGSDSRRWKFGGHLAMVLPS